MSLIMAGGYLHGILRSSKTLYVLNSLLRVLRGLAVTFSFMQLDCVLVYPVTVSIVQELA